MPDIWSGIGTEIAQSSHGEWLYKVGGQIRGPLPMQALAQKLVRGEIGLDTQVAREDGDFHPVARVAAFAQHVTEAKKQAGKRHAARTRKIILLSTVPALIVIAVAGWFIWSELARRRVDADRVRKAAEEALLQQRKKAEALPDMGLVALVSLGNEDSVKIHQTPSAPKRPAATPGKKTPAATAAKPEADEMVQTCKLSQGDILGTLKRSLSLINVCVEDERSRDTQNLLPPTLELDFVVQTSGRVTDFALTDRHYRKGPLANCLTKAFNTIQFPATNGANCPVTIPIKIGK
jgi:hypothetical protein